MCLPPGHIQMTDNLGNVISTPLLLPTLTTHLQSTRGKPSFSPTPQGKCLHFPHSPPSSSQHHLRFSKGHVETFGLFPADFPWLAWEIAGFPCSTAPVAIPSPVQERHSFLPTPFTTAQSRTRRQPWWAVPLSSWSCSPGSLHTCLGSCETCTRWLNISYMGSARLQLKSKNASPHLFTACLGTAQTEQQEPTLCREQGTHERNGKSLLSFPVFRPLS